MHAPVYVCMYRSRPTPDQAQSAQSVQSAHHSRDGSQEEVLLGPLGGKLCIVWRSLTANRYLLSSFSPPCSLRSNGEWCDGVWDLACETFSPRYFLYRESGENPWSKNTELSYLYVASGYTYSSWDCLPGTATALVPWCLPCCAKRAAVY